MSITTQKLPPQRLAALWTEFVDTRRDELRNQLAEHFMDVVYTKASKLAKRLPSEVDEQDLIQWGTLGLMQAVAAFDPGRGWKFSTYASRRVVGAMLDGLRHTARCNRNMMDKARRLNESEDALQVKLGRTSTPEETADSMRITPARYQSMQRTRQLIYSVPLDKPRATSDWRGSCEADSLADTHTPNPLKTAESAEALAIVLQSMLTKFKVTEALIVRLYYFEHMTMNEIAPLLGRTESSVCSLHTKIINTLRAMLAA